MGPLAGVGSGFCLTIGTLGLSFFTGAVGVAFAAGAAVAAFDVFASGVLLLTLVCFILWRWWATFPFFPSGCWVRDGEQCWFFFFSYVPSATGP